MPAFAPGVGAPLTLKTFPSRQPAASASASNDASAIAGPTGTSFSEPTISECPRDYVNVGTRCVPQNQSGVWPTNWSGSGCPDGWTFTDKNGVPFCEKTPEPTIEASGATPATASSGSTPATAASDATPATAANDATPATAASDATPASAASGATPATAASGATPATAPATTSGGAEPPKETGEISMDDTPEAKEATKPAETSYTWAWVLGGVAAVVAVGYGMYKVGQQRRSNPADDVELKPALASAPLVMVRDE
jgi:hypothetical protein